MTPEIPDPERERAAAQAQDNAATRPGVPTWLRGLLVAGAVVLVGSLVYLRPAVAPSAPAEAVPVRTVPAEPVAAPGPPAVSGLEMIRPLAPEPGAAPAENAAARALPAPVGPEPAGEFDMPPMPQAPEPAPQTAPEPPRRRLEGFEPGSSRGVRSWRAPRRENAEEEAPTSGAFISRENSVPSQAPKPPAPAPAPPQGASPVQPQKARGRPSSRPTGASAAPVVHALPQVPQAGAGLPSPPIPVPEPAPGPARTAPLAAGSMGDEAGPRAARGPMPPNTIFRCGSGSGQWRNTLANTCSKSKEDCRTTDPRGTCLLDPPEPDIPGK